MTGFEPASGSPQPFPADDAAARALLAAVVESSEDAIITKTLRGVITSWNAAAERLLGYSAAEAIGRPITMLIPRDRLDEERLILAKLSAGERIEHYETVRVAKGNRTIDVALTISPVRNATGHVIGASKILRDITDRRRVERELQRLLAERNELLESERAARSQAEHLSRSKDQFLAILSHELRTPLNAILGWTHVLRRSEPSPADLAKGLEVIERNARLQGQLIEDLLDMSRIVAGQMRLELQPLMPCNFVQAAVESLRPVAESRGLRLDARLDPSVGPIRGDAARLQQVVWNLIANAVKFTPVGGRVLIGLERRGDDVEIRVEDTGVGIDAEFLPHVFERFRQADTSTTRHHGGIGLGLSIVKHIVDLHGGTVEANSAGADRGATFRVLLPLASPHRSGDEWVPRSGRPLAGALAQADLTGLAVLVVDDEADSRELVSRVLRDRGATVDTAAGAEAALASVEAHRPDVMVSDIGMPGIDGYELMRRVRELDAERGRRLPAIALTAFARSEDRTRALLAGFMAHVAKPVEVAEIVATVATVAGRIGRDATEQSG